MNKEVLRKLYGLRRGFKKKEDKEDCLVQELLDRKYKEYSLDENLETAVGIERAETRADVFNYVLRRLDEVIRDYEQGEDTFVCVRELRNYKREVLAHVGSVWHGIPVDDYESIFKERVLVNDENESIKLNKYALTDHFEVKLS